MEMLSTFSAFFEKLAINTINRTNNVPFSKHKDTFELLKKVKSSVNKREKIESQDHDKRKSSLEKTKREKVSRPWRSSWDHVANREKQIKEMTCHF